MIERNSTNSLGIWPGVKRKVLEHLDVKIPKSKSAADKTYDLFKAVVPKPVFSDTRTAADRIAFNILKDPSTRRVFFPRLLSYPADAQLTKSELQTLQGRLSDLQRPEKANPKAIHTTPREAIKADTAQSGTPNNKTPKRSINDQSQQSNKRQKTTKASVASPKPSPEILKGDTASPTHSLPSPVQSESFGAWLDELSGWLKTQKDPHQTSAIAGGEVVHQALKFSITHPTPDQVKRQVLENMKAYVANPKQMSLRDIGLNIALFNDFDRRFQRAGENTLLKVQTESLAEIAYEKTRQRAQN